MNIENKAAAVVYFTNVKLANWYKLSKEDYNVEGSGIARFDAQKKAIIIDYVEDGEEKTFEDIDWQFEEINYVYNVWQEFA